MTTYTEFQKLTDVIVGSTFNHEDFLKVADKEAAYLLQKVNEETAEDLDNLANLLRNEGIKVYRPNNLMKYYCDEPAIKTPWFEIAFPNHPLMPRDTLGVFGNNIVEMFTGSGGRFFENLAYTDICHQFFNSGYRWISMPMPQMKSKNIDYSESNQILYHSANIIKCGQDLFYSLNGSDHVSGKGTRFGLQWLKQELKEFTWNEVSTHGHCDGKLALLKPGVLLTWNKNWVPKKLSNWTVIEADSETNLPTEFEKMRKKRFYKNFIQDYLSHWIGYVDETVFDVNVLSISEDKVIFTGTNTKIFNQLEKLGITPIYWKFRHQYFWDGGIHCVTQDLNRVGSKEDYFA
ncbi:hypothetical protein EB155_10050 [archaeon]|nr:hypothetical protein [archaeon]